MEYLIIGGIAGVICACVAPTKGRSPIAWFLIGFLFPLIGIILVLVLSNLKEERRSREHAAAERRRLQEQLRQERMKNESFRQYAGQRLDAHDRSLGVDTRAAGALAGGATVPPPALPEAGAAPLPAARDGTPWFYEFQGRHRGPVPAARLSELARAGTIGPDTLVWREGDAGWRPMSQVPELHEGRA
jgi:hypothetical protein